MSLIDFAFKTTLPISIVAIVGMGIAHFFWQRYLDKKENINHEMMDVSEITTTAPAFYAHHHHSGHLYAAGRRVGVCARF